MENKNYFVITTNVDHRFYASGFDPQRIFAVQGDYSKIQCAQGCHDRLYNDEATIRRMAAEQKNCRVPASLVPKCPVCGGDMEINIRKDDRFVQDAAWYAAAARYEAFVGQADGRKVLLIELGVGCNTPSIIRFPFERMTYRNKSATLVRVNKRFPRSDRGKRRAHAVFRRHRQVCGRAYAVR